MAAEGAALEPNLRADLERVIRRLVAAGHIPPTGTRDIHLRVNADDRLAWYSATSVRVPATELEGDEGQVSRGDP